MVQVTKQNGLFTFHIQGWHKLWALKSEITIPEGNISRAYRGSNFNMSIWSLRLPGTHLPGLVTAGTFINKQGITFCDYSNKNNLLIVELNNEHYNTLAVEVEDVEAALKLFS